MNLLSSSKSAVQAALGDLKKAGADVKQIRADLKAGTAAAADNADDLGDQPAGIEVEPIV